MDPYLAQIMIFAGNFAPRGWAPCNGQLISIAQNSALFALLGTMYGGDGITTFGLPDLRGRVPVGVGTGPGMSNVEQGQSAGTQNVTLITQNIPPLSLLASTSAGTLQTPTAGAYLAQSNQRDAQYVAAGAQGATVPLSGIVTGSPQPVSIMQPYLGLMFCIATSGIFPSRN